MKYCRDCKHYDKWCARNVRHVADLVTGKKKKQGLLNPEEERAVPLLEAHFIGACGKRGRFWESK